MRPKPKQPPGRGRLGGKRNPDGLTDQRRRFVEEYLVDLNATAAAIRAGYAKRSAYDTAYNIMQEPAVRAAIDAGKRARSERTKVDADWVLNRLRAEAEADISDLYDKNGALKPVHAWPAIWRTGLVVGLDAIEEKAPGRGNAKVVGVLRKIRWADRTRTIELIGKHVTVSAFRDLLGHSGPDGGPIQAETKSVHKMTDAELEEVASRDRPAASAPTAAGHDDPEPGASAA